MTGRQLVTPHEWRTSSATPRRPEPRTPEEVVDEGATASGGLSEVVVIASRT